MSVSPFDVLDDSSRPPGKPSAADSMTGARSFRGRVVSFAKDATNTQPLFLFGVAPLTGGQATGERNNVVENVVLLQAGFGSLDRRAVPPSGIVYLPEIGSVVRCDWDGSRWCITGFYTGPSKTRLETGTDNERRRVSYNPGVETDTPRAFGLPGWDLPHWSSGIDPGDCLMGREQARVKVTGKGALIGADLFACRFYTSEGRVIERFGDRETRGVGFWENMRHRRGTNPQATRAVVQNPRFAALDPSMSCTFTRLVEMAPLPQSQRPYVLSQQGYVSRSVLNDGRSALTTEVPSFTAASELDSGDYVADRMAVVHPLQPENPEKPGGELDSLAYTTFDRQVDADGSWRLRSGNKGQAPGGTTDLRLDYDARRDELLISVGPSGAQHSTILVQGASAEQASVAVKTTNLRASVENDAEVTAKTVTVRGRIVLDGQVEVTEDLNVRGKVTAQGEVTGRGTSLSSHRHGGVDTGGGTTSRPV